MQNKINQQVKGGVNKGSSFFFFLYRDTIYVKIEFFGRDGNEL